MRAGHRPRRAARAARRLRPLRPAEPDEYALDDLLDGPRIPVERMEADLRELIATVQCRHLRALLDCVFGPRTETWQAFREAPAAKRYHQAYRHGLLEHSLTVAQSRVGDLARPSAAWTATSRSPARCCTTSASWTPTRPTRWRST